METLDKLLLIYQDALLKECWKYRKQNQDVWDLFQDASIKMAKSFHTYDSQQKFLPWARRVILSAYVDQERAIEQEFGETKERPLSLWNNEGQVQAEIEESAEVLLKLIPEEDAKLIEAIYVDGVSQTSLGLIMGISQPAVHKRLQKAKERFKEAYDEYFG